MMHIIPTQAARPSSFFDICALGVILIVSVYAHSVTFLAFHLPILGPFRTGTFCRVMFSISYVFSR